jgi:hypothetical protein
MPEIGVLVAIAAKYGVAIEPLADRGPRAAAIGDRLPHGRAGGNLNRRNLHDPSLDAT